MTTDGSDGRSTLVTGTKGMAAAERPEPCVVVIFGASGDLTRRELLPSLYELAARGLLPERFAVVGFARREWGDDGFRHEMREAVEEECAFREETWAGLGERLRWLAGDFTEARDFESLSALLDEIAEEREIPGNVLFHLATPPDFFPEIVDRLDASGLARDGEGWRRLVIEKPFGEDEASARALDRRLQDVFDEEQIYRIDHYLGKETVQNMLVFRFANPGFEPIWNRDHIDHVQITVAEEIGIGTRGAFYEETGVVRDMIQNHLFQLLCMTAIEPPVAFDGASLRDETVKVLRSVQPVDLREGCVRGQYGPGEVDGTPVPGYREEDDVDPESTTPTFAAVRLSLESWRWAGVPFYLRTGKRLARKLTEVEVHFKPTPHLMFPTPEGGRHGSVLTFRLQPEEGIVHGFAAKRPGPALRIQPVRMEFTYAEAFDVTEPPRAYAWLLLDAMQGDQTLFARADWIHEAWSIVDPVIDRWESLEPADFPNYAPGSDGPVGADELLARDGRRWSPI